MLSKKGKRVKVCLRSVNILSFLWNIYFFYFEWTGNDDCDLFLEI